MSRQPPQPDQNFYSSWHIWGKQLLKYLQQKEEERLSSPGYQLPTHFASGLPSAAQAGLLIFISNEDTPAVSTATGGWRRLAYAT